jgi:hypothetical protein
MKAVANNTSPGPDQAIITKYRIKEDSVHLRDENRTEIRIVGIAPVIEGVTANGDKLDQELFWVYYIDALNYLAQSPAPVRPGITWADVLQGRSFYGKTIKMNDRTTTPEIKEKPSKPR